MGFSPGSTIPSWTYVEYADGGDGDDSIEAGAATGRTWLDVGPGSEIPSTWQSAHGGPYADMILGSEFDDVLMGDDGNDTIDGKGGADNIWGDGGADTLTGGGGFDWIWGGLARIRSMVVQMMT